MVAEVGGNIFKYKQAIKKAEKKLEGDYNAMGVRAYSLVRKGEVDHPDLQEVADEIDATIGEIEQNKAAIDELKVQKAATRGTRCPNCGSHASAAARFCPGCGVDMQSASTAKATDTKRCPYCDAKLSADATFCRSCGTKVEAGTGMDTGEPSPTAAAAPPPPIAPIQAQVPEAEPETQGIGKCPHCGDPLAPEFSVCFNCGKQLQPTADVVRSHEDKENTLGSFRVKCPNCGWAGIDDQIIRDGKSEDGLCPQCGSDAWDYV